VDGDVEALEKMYYDHLSGAYPLCSLRSRIINGSTLLHTSCFFDRYDLIELLLKPTGSNLDIVDCNIRDYKGATAFHRSKSFGIMKILLDYNADINCTDLDGNITLHVKCYGENDSPTDLEAIEFLLQHGAIPTIRNKQVGIDLILTPSVHALLIDF
jgi:ankyrin repeat protein